MGFSFWAARTAVSFTFPVVLGDFWFAGNHLGMGIGKTMVRRNEAVVIRELERLAKLLRTRVHQSPSCPLSSMGYSKCGDYLTH